MHSQMLTISQTELISDAKISHFKQMNLLSRLFSKGKTYEELKKVRMIMNHHCKE